MGGAILVTNQFICWLDFVPVIFNYQNKSWNEKITLLLSQTKDRSSHAGWPLGGAVTYTV